MVNASNDDDCCLTTGTSSTSTAVSSSPRRGDASEDVVRLQLVTEKFAADFDSEGAHFGHRRLGLDEFLHRQPNQLLNRIGQVRQDSAEAKHPHFCVGYDGHRL